MRDFRGQTDLNKVCKWLGLDKLDLEAIELDNVREEFAKTTQPSTDNSKITIPSDQDLDSMLSLVL